MEPRCLLSVTPIQVGAVYIEQDIGTDVTGDTFLLGFDGGAAGTQLRQVVINGDQVIAGFGVGDVFFDTIVGGLGADGAYDFSATAAAGIDSVQATVADGGLTLTLDFVGFDAGEQFVFSIDVDEVEDFDPFETNPEFINDAIDPITSGVEFQNSLFSAQFTATDFYDVEAIASFRNRYDESLIASGLGLPADNADQKQDRTAGAFAQVEQEFIPAAISGFVYHDRNDNGLREPGELGLAGVSLQVIPVSTVDEQTAVTVFTDANGYYEVTSLAPGRYRIVESQPDLYLDGLDSVGMINGISVGRAWNPGDELTDIVLAGDEEGVEYNFGEVLPASISGRAQLSTRDGDCFGEDVYHEPILGATILLYGSDGTLVAETVTDANGEYFFGSLRPDSYTVVQVTPSDLIDGGARPGVIDGRVAGTVGDDGSVTIDLTGGDAADDVDFCDRQPASLEGKVFHDRGNEGRRDTEDEGIAGVTVQLLDQEGKVVAETVTDEDGCYKLTDLEAGKYDIREIHPEGWLDGIDSAGTINGEKVGEPDADGDTIRGVEIGWGDEGVEYNFAEFLAVSISGRVQLSNQDGDCFGEEARHEGVAGARVALFDADGRQVAETLTDANGYYAFTGLLPGTYSLVEETPVGLFDGGAQAGAIEGRSIGTVTDGNTITGITLRSDEHAADNLFCEHPPSTLEGKVYHDRNNNGRREAGEEGIAGVVVQLLDQDGNVVAETVTDRDGCYRFEDVSAGKYDIRQIQPTGWLDGLDSAGKIGDRVAGQPENPGDVIRCVELKWGELGKEFDFGELQAGTISGLVHTDLVLNCEFNPDDGESGIGGVTIELLDADGQVIATTVTNHLGQYRFEGLSPGFYTVRQLQPTDYFDGGWNDRYEKGEGNLIEVQLWSGQNVGRQNFCEIPSGKISGYVFQDGDTIVLEGSEELPERLADIRDGRRTPDDTALQGVALELRNGISGRPIDAAVSLPGTYSGGLIKAITDGQGYYEFVGLPPGSYAVYQLQPPEYIDGVDTPGTTSGFVFNPGEPVNNVVLQQLVVSPQNNAIVRISLPPGVVSTENNFSEVVVEHVEEQFVFNPEVPPAELRGLPGPVWVDSPQFSSVPALPQYLVQSFGDGSDSSLPSNWHLSVIDGGQPRGQGITVREANSVWMAASQSKTPAAAMSESAWRIPRHYAKAEPNQDIFFGMAGAIPVAADFNGDGFDEIGVYLRGQWFIDINANGQWDNEDLWARLGEKDDLPVTGDWDGDGKADIGVFGRAWPGDARAIRHEPGLPDSENSARGRQKNVPPEKQHATSGHRMLQHSATGRIRADLIDHVFHFGVQTDVPVVADWNGDGIATIGVFRQGKWHVDTDGDGKWGERDQIFAFGQPGDIPLTGDFNGDGVEDLAVYRNGVLHIDSNGNRRWDSGDTHVRQHVEHGHPVAGDWDGDGVDEIAIYRGTKAEGNAPASSEPSARTAMRDAG